MIHIKGENLRGKPAKIRLGKVQENLKKILRGYLCSHAQVIIEFVHMHEGLVWLPAVARLIESGPSHVELQGGSTIAVAAMSKDRLNDELLLVVLSDRQRIGADRIIDKGPRLWICVVIRLPDTRSSIV